MIKIGRSEYNCVASPSNIDIYSKYLGTEKNKCLKMKWFDILIDVDFIYPVILPNWCWYCLFLWEMIWTKLEMEGNFNNFQKIKTIAAEK